ncbi:hypothetical protein H634G_11517 [Metarhizium anisopliae BRIP 53293]|uniref:Uncharacterized protein n=1 Tax=Metarhizium anisopliae BRIP 53293 TaxID=1291518 RepID=A0A0D9NHY1_METAN|nr:hypothetical protein H634G_11517 [Metarhizium anisopliae BRIP 53293]
MEVKQLHYANDDMELPITHELNVALDIHLPVCTLLLQCWARFFVTNAESHKLLRLIQTNRTGMDTLKVPISGRASHIL